MHHPLDLRVARAWHPLAVPVRLCARLWSFALLAALLAAPLPVAAQLREGELPALPFSVTATNIRTDELGNYEAEGNVVLQQSGGASLRADWVAVNRETRLGVAVGNVEIRDQGDLVQADFAAIDLDSLKALATSARIDSANPPMAIAGEEIRRTGASTYQVRDGTFTTCRCPPGEGSLPWQIDVAEADVEVGGYAWAKGVTMRALGVPIFYAPLFVFPVKTERETGFLIPSYSNTSRGGNEFATPFFWAAADNLNVLLTPTYFSKRGLKLNTEFEYVLGEQTVGRGGFAALPGDDDIRGGDMRQRFSDDRFAFWLEHSQPLAPGARLGLDLNRVSDNQYLLDFEDFSSEQRSSRFLESSAFASYGRPGLYAGVEAALVDDLQSPNDLDRDDFVLQRLPEVNLNVLPRQFAQAFSLPFFASMDSRYTYFYQRKDLSSLRGNAALGETFFDTGQDGLFDADEVDAAGNFPGIDVDQDNFATLGGTEGDGMFQEGELLADRGHRLDFYPRLSMPARIGWLESITEGGVRETLYLSNNLGSQSRTLLTARTDVRARFQRDFSFARLRFRHLLEPRVGFALLSAPSQERDPLFVPASSLRIDRLIDADPRVLLRNPSDRIQDERFLNFGVANRFYAAPGAEGAPLQLVGEFRAGTGYDFETGRATNLFLDAQLNPTRTLSVATLLGYDYRDTRIEEAEATFAWRSLINRAPPGLPERRSEAVVSYRYVRDAAGRFENFLREDDVFDEFDRSLDRINQMNLSGNFVLTRNIDVFAGGYVSFDQSSTRSGSVGLLLTSSCACWEIRGFVESRTRPDDTRFAIELRLAGLGFGSSQPGLGARNR